MTKQTVITKFFLTAAAVQVNPQFAADVILDAGVFLIVQSVQRPADNRVHLHQKKGFSMTKKIYSETSLPIGKKSPGRSKEPT